VFIYICYNAEYGTIDENNYKIRCSIMLIWTITNMTCDLIQASEIFNNCPPYLNAMTVLSYDFQKEINLIIVHLF